MKKTYDIKILGQKFSLRTENDETHVKRVADFVNKIMHELQQKSSNISTQNIAILGALNIADEMISKELKTKSLIKDWKERLENIQDLSKMN